MMKIANGGELGGTATPQLLVGCRQKLALYHPQLLIILVLNGTTVVELMVTRSMIHL